MAKLQPVKLAIDKILNAETLGLQAAVLLNVTDHPALATACKLVGIDTTKVLALSKFVWKQ
jgi:hypothetical protein